MGWIRQKDYAWTADPPAIPLSKQSFLNPRQLTARIVGPMWSNSHADKEREESEILPLFIIIALLTEETGGSCFTLFSLPHCSLPTHMAVNFTWLCNPGKLRRSAFVGIFHWWISGSNPVICLIKVFTSVWPMHLRCTSKHLWYTHNICSPCRLVACLSLFSWDLFLLPWVYAPKSETTELIYFAF